MRRYRVDLFFRSQTNIIAVHLAFFGILLALFAFALHITQDAVIETITRNIQEVLVRGAEPSDAEELTRQLDDTTSSLFAWVVIVMGAAVLVFGHVLSRITLFPAQRALETQKRFIRDVAHELRTPLATLRMNADLKLMEADDIPPGMRELIEGSADEIDRMSGIINNLLALDSFTQTSTPFAIEDVDLESVVRRSLWELSPLAERHRITTEIHVETPCLVRGNATALEQATTNIIKNAILYSSKDSTVFVHIARSSDGFAALVVRDTGTGITKKDLRHVFEPFYRADQSRKKHGSGSGIGLTLVNEIVKRHRGKISLRSKEGAGTAVTIFLPLAQTAEGTLAHMSDRTRRGADDISVDYSR